MAAEIKHGKKVETHLAPSLHSKFKSKCKKNNTNMAQVIRDAVQAYVKGK